MRGRLRHGATCARLEIAPNLWAGVGLVRGGAGTALVGDPKTGGRAHRGIRGARASTTSSSRATRTSRRRYRFAELVFPLLPLQAARASCRGAALTGPFGEVVANLDAPSRLVSQS